MPYNDSTHQRGAEFWRRNMNLELSVSEILAIERVLLAIDKAIREEQSQRNERVEAHDEGVAEQDEEEVWNDVYIFRWRDQALYVRG